LDPFKKEAHGHGRENEKSRGLVSALVVISPVGTISGKSLKLLPPDVIFQKLKCTEFDFGWDSGKRGREGKGLRGGKEEGKWRGGGRHSLARPLV